MSKKAYNKNRIINGSHGKVFWDGVKLSNAKSMEAKATMAYEEINQPGSLTTAQRYMGYSIAGTITLYKIDSFAAEKMVDAIKSGVMPESTIIAALEDPAAYGYERVELTGVTFDELTLMSWENRTLGEEELPFKAEDFRYLDKIS